MNEVIREYQSWNETLPAEARGWIWLAYQTVTLAMWPCGQGTTRHVWKRCPHLKVEKEDVVLTRPGGEGAS